MPAKVNNIFRKFFKNWVNWILQTCDKTNTSGLLSTTYHLVNMETMQAIREARDLPSDLDWARALLLKVNCPSHLTGTLQNTHSLHHCDSWEY